MCGDGSLQCLCLLRVPQTPSKSGTACIIECSELTETLCQSSLDCSRWDVVGLTRGLDSGLHLGPGSFWVKMTLVPVPNTRLQQGLVQRVRFSW